MKLDRRAFSLSLLGAFAGTWSPAWANGSARALLERELASGRACGGEAAAVRASLSRLAAAKPPARGRALVIDIPSQHLAAYSDGALALESRVVVGDPAWRTPDLDTTVTFVRFNPTWTVPESIVGARSWRAKLARDPGYFGRRNFDVDLGGRLVDPSAARGNPAAIRRFVQRPGPGNALGKVKLGLAAGGAVYLHDTSEPNAFDEDARALSHGCIRVERAMDVAAWALDLTSSEAESLLDGDDQQDRRPPAPVRVMTTYLTAWPDATGAIRYYPDVYGLDGAASGACATAPSADRLPGQRYLSATD